MATRLTAKTVAPLLSLCSLSTSPAILLAVQRAGRCTAGEEKVRRTRNQVFVMGVRRPRSYRINPAITATVSV